MSRDGGKRFKSFLTVGVHTLNLTICMYLKEKRSQNPLIYIGAHHFYLRRWAWGIAYFFTFGLFGIGWVIDMCRMPTLVKMANEKLLEKCEEPSKDKLACEAYVLCLVPFTGLLGGHHYYLGRYVFGIMYTFTFGLLGLGWLVDICRLTCLVNRVNKERQEGIVG